MRTALAAPFDIKKKSIKRATPVSGYIVKSRLDVVLNCSKNVKSATNEEGGKEVLLCIIYLINIFSKC